jgi:carbon-monoxide dehydrogenase medium subunit/xanthine dehydrogenase FAD-binding subunit
MLTCDDYRMPVSFREALELWTSAPQGSRLVTGATDVLPWAREGRAGDVHLPAIVDLSRVAELAGYRVEGGKVRIGAALPYQHFLEDKTLRRHLPCMPYCAVWFADDQIRQQATLAGNIVNASPAADGTPPVLAMNGEIELARLEGGEVVTRTMPVAEFVLGPGRTALGEGEIVTAIICDSMAGYGGAFEKVGQRRSLVISAVCAAALVKPDAAGRKFEDVRLALAGIGPVPVRLHEVEAALKGQAVSRRIVAEAAALPADIIRSRTRRDYRRKVVRGFIEAAILGALADAGVRLPEEAPREAAHV